MERDPVRLNARYVESLDGNPPHWFRPIATMAELPKEPVAIEYLCMPSGEVLSHVLGTAFWSREREEVDLETLKESGVTHWRLR